ncbi:MAG: hypothetical protein JXR52_02605 [Bacteroidales bacterium]|nr:hypothetical protein [Bacteroidales bacterium]
MKNRINKILFVLAAVVLFVSCEPEYIMFDSSKNFVAFTAKSANMVEPGGKIGIPVLLTALPNSPAATVTFDFSTEGLGDKAAAEGTDFTLLNSSKTLNFPDGWGYDTIWVQPVDNDEFTGNKLFYIELLSNSEDYQFGVNQRLTVTLVDDEHPLKNWIGNYDIAALSNGSPGAWDESWTAVTSAVEGDVTVLSILITAGGATGTPFQAAFDMEEMTITITAGTDFGNFYGYGSMVAYLSDYFTYLDKESPIVGTIANDGTIQIDNVGLVIATGTYAGYIWDSFNLTWTKTGKKAADQGPVPEEKAARFK